ncbi:MAG: DHA2 family efflux MFS transporter permease subunit [Acidobacteria bacterium]|nr:MAG: DHA2 family efflux MFS transporter permease subunit [Acidobacteriota bacterium]
MSDTVGDVTAPSGAAAAGVPTAPAPLTHRQILIVFSGLMTGLLLAALDQTIVATALPTIVGELGGLEHYSWVVTAYLLTSTVSTPLYGKISDLYGRKAVFQTAILIFLAGSLLAGLAQTMVQLVLCRGIQGAGAGGLMAMTFAVVGDVVAPRERGRYTGYLGSVFAFASVVGPLLGGFIVDHVSWRWVFLINLPVGAMALVVTSSVLKPPLMRRAHRIDVEGAVLLVTAVSCLVLALVWGGTEYPWGSMVIIGLGLAGVVLTLAFVAWESRVPEPTLPLRLFGNRIFSVTAGLGFLIGCGMFGGIIFLPLFLQIVTGASATNSGLLMLPLMGGLMTASITSGRIISRTGRYKVWPVTGMAVAAAGMFLLSLMGPDTTRLESSFCMLVLGLGIGMVMQVLVLAVQNAVAYADLGVATAAATFFRSMGGLFGVAVFGAILNTRMAEELPRLVPAAALAEAGGRASQLLSSPAQIRLLPPEIRNGIIEALSLSIHSVFLWAIPLLLAGFALSWFLDEIPLRETVHTGQPSPGERPQSVPGG